MITKKTVFYGLGLVLLAGMLFFFNPVASHAQGMGIIVSYVYNCGGCGGAISGATVICIYHGESCITDRGYCMQMVSAGTHRLRFSHPDFWNKEKTVTVGAGQTVNVDVCLNKR